MTGMRFLQGCRTMFACISTKDRDHFYDWSRTMIDRQTIPVTVVIVDGSAEPSRWSTWPDAIYIHRPNVALGLSRNIAMDAALSHGAAYIAIWDDDDYYEPCHLEEALRLLDAHPEAMAAGSTVTPLYFPQYDEMWVCGPYAETHSIEPALVFRAALAKSNRFDPADRCGLGAPFLNDFTVPIVQNKKRTHIAIAHRGNTVSKEPIRQTPSKYLATRIDVMPFLPTFREVLNSVH